MTEDNVISLLLVAIRLIDSLDSVTLTLEETNMRRMEKIELLDTVGELLPVARKIEAYIAIRKGESAMMEEHKHNA